MSLPTMDPDRFSEVIERLKDMRGEFVLQFGREIRHLTLRTEAGSRCCPLAAIEHRLTGRARGNSLLDNIARRIGLQYWEVSQIMLAADMETEELRRRGHDDVAALRIRILCALEL